MNEFKRCLNVFTHSPFKVRLMLVGMLCDLINGNPHRINPTTSAASRYAASFFCHISLPDWLITQRFSNFFKFCKLSPKTIRYG